MQSADKYLAVCWHPAGSLLTSAGICWQPASTYIFVSRCGEKVNYKSFDSSNNLKVETTAVLLLENNDSKMSKRMHLIFVTKH